MRVTTETKAATRRKILEVAGHLFAQNRFHATTTRDIARAAGIASGTLFNYFPTKEAVLACLAGDAMDDAIADAEAQSDRTSVAAPGPASDPVATLEEDLFALVAATLRKLRHLRPFLPALLETALNPIASGPQPEAQSFRTRHLEAVVARAARHGFHDLSPVALQLYWTLYTGLLVFWSHDASPHQEDTLALADESLNMFAAWLRHQPGGPSAEPRTA